MILATGSVALPIPGVEFGGRVVDTWGAWSLPEQPKSIAVVGAGASGAEIASAYGRFGTEVILIEMLDQILPAEDKDMARVVERAFKKQGITVVDRHQGRDGRGRQELGQGRVRRRARRRSTTCASPAAARPDTEPLGLEAAGVEIEDGGKVKVDAYQRTSNPKVYAIGDLVRAEGARPQGLRGGRRRGRDASPAPRPTRSTRTSSPARPSASRRWRASGSPRRARRRQARDVKVGQVQARRRRRGGRLRRPGRAW